MVFISQTRLILMYLMYFSDNMFRLAIESSSGPYIKIQILNLLEVYISIAFKQFGSSISVRICIFM